MQNNHYDLIIIGVGSMGSSALYHAAKAGLKVLGIDQFEVPHVQGSHSGHTRLIRKAYFEHPTYVPLLEIAYDSWAELEEITGEKLFYKTGLVYFGPAEEELIHGVRNSAKIYDLNIEDLDRQNINERFSEFKIPESLDGVFEADAGFVVPEKTIELHVNLAKEAGAQILQNTKVSHWQNEGDHITVKTENENYAADKVIISAGAWSSKVVLGLHDNIRASRQSLFWVKPQKSGIFDLGNFPCWNIQTRDHEGLFYGFPNIKEMDHIGAAGFKLAHHFPGTIVDPDQVDRQIPQKEFDYINSFLSGYIPDAQGPFTHQMTCLYGNSPDQDFIIDFLPDTDGKVVVAAGFSGHGFKFVPAIGKVLTEMIVCEKKNEIIDFISLDRFC